MAVQGGINVQGNIQGVTSGGPLAYGPITIPAVLPEPDSHNVNVGTSLSTVTCSGPTNPGGVLIIPPATNTTGLNLCTSGGSAVIALGVSSINALSLNGTTSIYLEAATGTVLVQVIFF